MHQDNYQDVLNQLEDIGFKPRMGGRDLPLKINTPRKVTCGIGGKFWYRLSEFRPDAGGCYLVGSFGSYRDGSRHKVIVDWTPLKEAERARFRAERKAAAQRAAIESKRLADEAALSASELWAKGNKEGKSGYLRRKGVEGESCKYMPDGSILVPLIRYDLPRAQALRGVQRIWSNGRKLFTTDFAKAGTAVRLGVDPVCDRAMVVMFAEGYATGLSLRMATGKRWPVYVALDCHNLIHVLQMMRTLYPYNPFLICADDDWKTMQPVRNPGRHYAKAAAKAVGNCSLIWPVFPAKLTRSPKDTDYNDLHKLAGIDAVGQQLSEVIKMIGGVHGR